MSLSRFAGNHAGAAAGAITGIATTPLDVVKTRLMTQGSNRTYAGVVDAFTKIWREEGAQAFLSVSCSHGKMAYPFSAALYVQCARARDMSAAAARSLSLMLLTVQGWQPRVVWIGIGGCVFFTGASQPASTFGSMQCSLCDGRKLMLNGVPRSFGGGQEVLCAQAEVMTSGTRGVEKHRGESSSTACNDADDGTHMSINQSNHEYTECLLGLPAALSLLLNCAASSRTDSWSETQHAQRPDDWSSRFSSPSSAIFCSHCLSQRNSHPTSALASAAGWCAFVYNVTFSHWQIVLS